MRIHFGKAGLLLSVTVGIFIGVGAFAFDYGEGFSYFSTDPAACNNCHIMNDQFNSWQKAGHHQSAVCVDCHLPHEFVPKYIAKARNGYNHSSAFTFMNFPEPIQITPPNAEILQANCIRCHGDFVHEVIQVAGGGAPDAVQCVHCHRNVGHGARQ